MKILDIKKIRKKNPLKAKMYIKSNMYKMQREKGSISDGNRNIATIFTYNSRVMFWSYIV